MVFRSYRGHLLHSTPVRLTPAAGRYRRIHRTSNPSKKNEQMLWKGPTVILPLWTLVYVLYFLLKGWITWNNFRQRTSENWGWSSPKTSEDWRPQSLHSITISRAAKVNCEWPFFTDIDACQHVSTMKSCVRNIPSIATWKGFFEVGHHMDVSEMGAWYTPNNPKHGHFNRENYISGFRGIYLILDKFTSFNGSGRVKSCVCYNWSNCLECIVFGGL